MRKIREYEEVRFHAMSLDELITKLTELRDRLPEDAEPVVRMKGDDFIGRRLCVAHLRDQTEAELALDAKYADAENVKKAA